MHSECIKYSLSASGSSAPAATRDANSAPSSRAIRTSRWPSPRRTRSAAPRCACARRGACMISHWSPPKTRTLATPTWCSRHCRMARQPNGWARSLPPVRVSSTCRATCVPDTAAVIMPCRPACPPMRRTDCRSSFATTSATRASWPIPVVTRPASWLRWRLSRVPGSLP